MTVDAEIEARILDKAEHVEQSVTFLSRKQDLDREEYLSDWEQQAIVERTFQTAIEACLDLAELLIKRTFTGFRRFFAKCGSFSIRDLGASWERLRRL